MRGLEQAHRSTGHNHSNRNEKMGPYRLMVTAAGIIRYVLSLRYMRTGYICPTASLYEDWLYLFYRFAI
jgi:hypothetical protein